MTYCLGVDVWEGEVNLDYAALKANGIDLTIHRLNDMVGGHHMDAGFALQWDLAGKSGMLRALYFVYNPWADGTINYQWLKAHIPADYTGRVFIDVEVTYPGYSAAIYSAQVLAFLKLCEGEHLTAIYTGEWFLPNLKTWPKGFDYWWAQYPYSLYPNISMVTSWEAVRKIADGLTAPANAAKCPGTIKLWQITGDRLILPGSIKPIDVNLFIGSQADLFTWITGKAPAQPPAPEPAPEPVVEILTVEDFAGKTPELFTVTYTVNGLEHRQVLDQRPPAPPVVIDPHPNIYRVLDDVEAGIEAFGGPRPYIRDAKVGPPTVKLEGGSSFYKVPELWVGYLQKINTAQGINYINKPGSGWRNGTVDWVVRTVTFAGNIVEVLSIDGNKAYIKTISTDDDLPRDSQGKVIYIKPTEGHLHPLLPIFVLQYILTGSAYDPKSTVRLDYSTDLRYVTILLMAPAGENLWIDIRSLRKL